MHEIIERRIDFLLSQIEKIKNTEEDLLIAMEVLPNAQFWVDHEVNVYWSAKSMDEIKAALRAFARRGMMLINHIPNTSKPIWTVQGKNTTITISPYWSTDDEGASCRLVRTGTRNVPIYKLVCDEMPDVGGDNDVSD